MLLLFFLLLLLLSWLRKSHYRLLSFFFVTWSILFFIRHYDLTLIHTLRFWISFITTLTLFTIISIDYIIFFWYFFSLKSVPFSVFIIIEICWLLRLRLLCLLYFLILKWNTFFNALYFLILQFRLLLLIWVKVIR